MNFVQNNVPQGSYQYRVTAVRMSCGTVVSSSAPSNVASVLAALPATPTGVGALAGPAAQQITVNWSSAQFAQSYQIERATGNANNFGNRVTVLADGSTTYSQAISNLTTGTNYRFRIRGVNSLGNSNWVTVGPVTAP
jgi:predicted phage tail protein